MLTDTTTQSQSTNETVVTNRATTQKAVVEGTTKVTSTAAVKPKPSKPDETLVDNGTTHWADHNETYYVSIVKHQNEIYYLLRAWLVEKFISLTWI